MSWLGKEVNYKFHSYKMAWGIWKGALEEEEEEESFIWLTIAEGI